jgi:hypothetical protein
MLLVRLAVGAALVLPGCEADRPGARAAGCEVTLPGGALPAAAEDEGFNYGNGEMAVLLWPRGTLLAGRRPDGASFAEVGKDGSIAAKLGWWRQGLLRIEGHRLDRRAPPLRAGIAADYPPGFQPSGLVFPTPGCWEVTGRAGDSELTFVVRVRKLGSATSAPSPSS